jgi:dolichyl-phosphate beta-glucosyltransferase
MASGVDSPTLDHDVPSATATNPVLTLPISLSVIVPMYREERRVGATLMDLIPALIAGAYPSEIILVDDGSPDRTLEVVRPTLREKPEGSLQRVVLQRHGVNRGKGAAVRTGLGAARGVWRLIMDADNACRIDQAEKLLAEATPGMGLVAGSRVARGAHVQARAHRRFTGWVFKSALSVLGLNIIQDTQCGFKLYRADLADQVVLHGREDGYAFDLEHLLLARASGLAIAEVGVAWAHKDGGQVSPVRDGLKMLRAGMRLRRTWSVDPPAIARLPYELDLSAAAMIEHKPAGALAPEDSIPSRA